MQLIAPPFLNAIVPGFRVRCRESFGFSDIAKATQVLRLDRIIVASWQVAYWPERPMFHSCGASQFGDYTFSVTGFQMLIWRVSGIRNRLSTKHTAGTAIG